MEERPKTVVQRGAKGESYFFAAPQGFLTRVRALRLRTSTA